MAQDIKKLLQEDLKTTSHSRLEERHHERFEKLLNKELPLQAKPLEFISFWKVAAVLLIVFAAGYFSYLGFNTSSFEKNIVESAIPDPLQKQNTFSMGDISPDLKKIENYYLSNINFQLGSIKFSEENKDLLDGYMVKLNELDEEYQALNQELNDQGLNPQLVNALIDNLKLRLELLFKLKNKLNEFNTSKSEQLFNNKI